MSLRFITHAVACVRIPSFLRLNSIPLCVCVCMCVYVCCMCMYVCVCECLFIHWWTCLWLLITEHLFNPCWPFACHLWRKDGFFAHFFSWIIWFFLLLSFRRSLYILDINPLFWILTQIFFNRKIFSLFCRLPFTPLIVPFDAQKFLS